MEIQRQRLSAEAASSATLILLAVSAAFNGGKAAKLFNNTVEDMTR